MAVHPDISLKTKNVNLMVSLEEKSPNNKVIRIHPLGTLKIRKKINGKQSTTLVEILHSGAPPADIITPRALLLMWLKTSCHDHFDVTVYPQLLYYTVCFQWEMSGNLITEVLWKLKQYPRICNIKGTNQDH